MGAGGKTVGGPKPCTIQASFNRSATTGAKHNTHIHAREYHTHTHTPKHTWPKSCVLQQKLPEASSANPNSILRTLSFPHTSA